MVTTMSGVNMYVDNLGFIVALRRLLLVRAPGSIDRQWLDKERCAGSAIDAVVIALRLPCKPPVRDTRK